MLYLGRYSSYRLITGSADILLDYVVKFQNCYMLNFDLIDFFKD